MNPPSPTFGLKATKAFQGSWAPSPPVEDLLKCVDAGLSRTPPGLQIPTPYARAHWEDWRITLPAEALSQDLIAPQTGQYSRFQGYRFAARSGYQQDPGSAGTLELDGFVGTDEKMGILQLGFYDSGFPPFFIEASEFLVDATLKSIASELRSQIFGGTFPVVLQMQAQGVGWFHHKFNFPREY